MEIKVEVSCVIDVSTIIVSFNTIHLIPDAVKHLRMAAQGLSHEIVFVDNASSDFSAELIGQSFSEDKLIANKTNFGFGRANNQALPFTHGRYVLLLNTDAFVAPDTLLKTVAYMDAHPNCGILGVRLEGRDGKLQPCARYFPTPWNLFLNRTGLGRFFPSVQSVDDMEWDHNSIRSCDWVVGCYYLVRREVIDQIGLFDPRYFLYYEEVDHCFAAKKAGWNVVFYPFTTVVHLGGESAKSSGVVTKSGRQLSVLQAESELLFMRKNYGFSGFVAYIFLTLIASLIIVIKGFRKPDAIAIAGTTWEHTKLFVSLMRRTRLASMPTR